MGAAEGTGLGFLAAGATLGMVWLGESFGNPLPVDEAGYALGFLVIGTGILVGTFVRARMAP